MLARIKHRGALFVEYALLLAFVAFVGVAFLADGGLSQGINGIFGKTAQTLNSAKKQDKNTATNFADFCARFREISDQRTAQSDEKKLLNTVLEAAYMENSSEKSFASLSDADKEALESLGLNYGDFSNACFYKDNDTVNGANKGRWYVCWTQEDLSSKKEGDTVKVMVYSASGKASGSDKSGYYVGTTTYQKDAKSGQLSITNNQKRYDTKNNIPGLSDPKSGYTHYDTKEAAVAAYNRL